MSETPKRKRLTDGDAKIGADSLKALHFACDDRCSHFNEDEYHCTAEIQREGAHAVADDYLQAREDRKRLAEWVRALARALKELDGDKWFEDGLITDALSFVAEVDP